MMGSVANVNASLTKPTVDVHFCLVSLPVKSSRKN